MEQWQKDWDDVQAELAKYQKLFNEAKTIAEKRDYGAFIEFELGQMEILIRTYPDG